MVSGDVSTMNPKAASYGSLAKGVVTAPSNVGSVLSLNSSLTDSAGEGWANRYSEGTGRKGD